MAAIDPELAGKLPAPAHSREPAGVVQPDIARQFGFGPDVLVRAAATT